LNESAKTFIAASVLFTNILSLCAAINTNAPPQIVFNNLTSYCPMIDPEIISGWKGYIAAEAGKGATNLEMLNTNLLVLFASTNSALNWLGWTNNQDLLTIAAAHIACVP